MLSIYLKPRKLSGVFSFRDLMDSASQRESLRKLRRCTWPSGIPDQNGNKKQAAEPVSKNCCMN